MKTLVVVNSPEDWPLEIAGVEVVAARDYLTHPDYPAMKRVLVFNLCRSYAYQSTGYYVSLLAAARGHKHMPGTDSILGMQSAAVVRHVSSDLDNLIQQKLRRLQSEDFTLSIYFGRNMASTYDRLARQLFNIFQTPFIRAYFSKDTRWRLTRVSPIAARDIPESHMGFVIEAARSYFAKPRFSTVTRKHGRYDLAILYDPDEPTPPSDERAIKKFMAAARECGFEPEIIDRDDYGRVAEFDALFIRDTTEVRHYTFKFAQKAEAEGLVVIDDTTSILRCTNKVFLAELLDRKGIATPKTAIVSRENLETVMGRFSFPIILKQPDSSFSQGVVKVADPDEFRREAGRLLQDSDLILAQQFTPTEYDWRIGIIDGRPLYACRYFMAHRHWQIIKKSRGGKLIEGKSDTLELSEVPKKVLSTALAAAGLIGDGLYGVDIKEVNGRPLVIEVNDNPSIEAGYEDAVLKEKLYLEIMRTFQSRVESRKEKR